MGTEGQLAWICTARNLYVLHIALTHAHSSSSYWVLMYKQFNVQLFEKKELITLCMKEDIIDWQYVALDGKYKDAFPTKTFSSIKLFSLNYSKDWMHTVACPDRIVHHSALNMKMKTFWSLNLDFHSDSVCNLLYTLQSSILFIHIWIWSCTVLKPNKQYAACS